MTDTGPVCEQCGAPARIHASDVVKGVPTLRHFCNSCYDDVHVEPWELRRHWSLAAVLACVGAVVLGLSISADWHQLGKFAGFGWQQKIGVVLGGVLLVFGAVARTPTLVVMGLVTACLSLLADWIAFGESEGFGWKQILGAGVGVAFVAAAFYVGRPQRR